MGHTSDQLTSRDQVLGSGLPVCLWLHVALCHTALRSVPRGAARHGGALVRTMFIMARGLCKVRWLDGRFGPATSVMWNWGLRVVSCSHWSFHPCPNRRAVGRLVELKVWIPCRGFWQMVWSGRSGFELVWVFWCFGCGPVQVFC